MSLGESAPHENTRVAIIGAGPAGLLLGWALRDTGINSIVMENRSQEYVLGRIRAGVLEQGSVETLTRLGVGDRLASEGLQHDGIFLQYAGERHNVNFNELIGRTVTDKSITPMRSFVASRLAYGNLFLVGDAGHIVPPTGATTPPTAAPCCATPPTNSCASIRKRSNASRPRSATPT